MLIVSAHKIMEENAKKADKIVDYSFDKKWIKETTDILDIVSSIDKNFPSVEVIVKDKIDNVDVYLGFRYYYNRLNDTIPLKKVDYIQKTTQEEREYLKNVFDKKINDTRFSASDGNYELFYPYSKNGKQVIFYFSDYQRYGKFGS